MMASSSTNSWLNSLKLLFITTGVISLAITAKLTVPLMLNFAVNDLPTMMKPPYLCLIINCIILTIVATSRFQTNHRHENQSPPLDSTPDAVQMSFHVMEPPRVGYDIIKPCVTVEHNNNKCYEKDVETVVVEDQEDELITTKDIWHPTINDQPEIKFQVEEKQLVTSSHRRKPAKHMQEGERALRVLKPKKHETLDNTWKMITESRNKPSARQFRKSDTFVNLHHDRPSHESTKTVNTKAVRKSETVKERKAYENQNHHPQSQAAEEKLKRYLSPSHEELNRRVEEFIKKFNEDMRLQRQESLNQYMEMINRGGH
ncbi:hypothetical protein M8C21_007414 [Ambrosia artemisiifolia]|uniref:DUF4408 domain-containing protein n=1 Tax=Ambrosia artemisiifolia TaxID=4212 RepID=A0AAD5GWH7_AMBAR|nr:hypothetical protein M8C21_007414 [Ambrosia artemisiifolia]